MVIVEEPSPRKTMVMWIEALNKIKSQAERIAELESLLRDSHQYIEAVIRLADSNGHEHPKATAFLEEVDKALAQ